MAVDFVHNLDVTYGEAISLKSNLRCLTAPNKGPFTYTGTGTFIIGTDSVAIIDPGPLMNDHIEGLLEAIGDKILSHILVTHTHLDHSPASEPLSAATGAPIFAFGPHGTGKGGGLDDEVVEEGADKSFSPTNKLKDGALIKGEDWTFKAIHTPGHTSNHICFHWLEENVIFTGDHIMGWSTSVISPPDGDMGAYMASLEKLKATQAKALYPTHGPAILNPNEFISSLIAHRKERGSQIYEAVSSGKHNLQDITAQVYSHIGPELRMAAERNTLAHLIHLVEQTKISSDQTPSPKARFELR